jgi:uncharacterized protein
MPRIPKAVSEFLSCRNIAVAGVSRSGAQPANAIFKRLRETGHNVVPVNPNASVVEGQTCYPDLRAIPDPIEAVMMVTHPDVATDLVRQAAERGVTRIWFHRSFGSGSVSSEAIEECKARGIRPIIGGCPMMYCGNVDVGHKCMRWWLDLRHRLPA